MRWQTVSIGCRFRLSNASWSCAKRWVILAIGSNVTLPSTSYTHRMSRFRSVANAALRLPPATWSLSSKTRRCQIPTGAPQFGLLSSIST
jgi:hypothetical protein